MSLFKRSLIFTLFFAVSNILIAANSDKGPVLVTTDWLAKNLNNKNIVLLDMSDGLQYQRFHIPGAINLPYEVINQTRGKVSLSVGPRTVGLIMNELGISNDNHIVIYDDTGGLHAGRLYWELKQIGHKQVSIVDGGLVKWIREERKISFTPTAPRKKTRYKVGSEKRTDTASLDDVIAARDSNTVLLDVRSKEEYIGDKRYKRTGHIPGAVWLPWDNAMDVDAGFTLKSPPDILIDLNNVGITDKEQPIIVYCRSGHRAAHTYYMLKQFGFKNVKLYDGSMKEYERRANLPLKLGREP